MTDNIKKLRNEISVVNLSSDDRVHCVDYNRADSDGWSCNKLVHFQHTFLHLTFGTMASS
jgi:hypothetical protein